MSDSKQHPQSDELFLEHILIEAQRIGECMAGRTVSDLADDWKLEHTVTRSFEIMGEASGRISNEMKKRYPDLPWRNMKEMRNRVIHQYYEVDYCVVQDIIVKQLPLLIEQLRNILSADKTKLSQDVKNTLHHPRKHQPLLIKKKRSSKRRGLGL